jgi:hypothetical protein
MPMKKTLLFAIDPNTEEVIVSETQAGSNKVLSIERIGKQKNEELYKAVTSLTSLARSPKPDPKAFEAMDKVCQGLYRKLKGAGK